MSGATRKDQDSAGGTITSGSPNVIINGSPAARIGDSVAGHGLPPHSAPTMAEGSPTVITNSIPQCHEGDTATCGHPATGSPNVFVGDQSFTVNVQVEPGVVLISGNTVYDSSPAGQAASVRDETAFSPSLPGNPVSGDTPPPAGAEANPVYGGCEQFNATITMSDMSKPVSKWFKLANCKELPVDQRGLTSSQIACNWAKLCQNVLDPVRDAGHSFSFNSGFRNASRDSGGDHGIGCAADISCGSDATTIVMFKWMIANQATLGFSQIIYEKHNSSWVHVAYNGKGPKGEARTMWTYTGSAPYGHGGQNGTGLPVALA